MNIILASTHFKFNKFIGDLSVYYLVTEIMCSIPDINVPISIVLQTTVWFHTLITTTVQSKHCLQSRVCDLHILMEDAVNTFSGLYYHYLY